MTNVKDEMRIGRYIGKSWCALWDYFLQEFAMLLKNQLRVPTLSRGIRYYYGVVQDVGGL